MSLGQGGQANLIRNVALIAVAVAPGGAFSLHAQSCAGLPTRLFSLSATASTSSEERTLEVSPGVRLGPAFVRLSVERLVPRAGLGWDGRYGAGVTFGKEAFPSAVLRICPMFGTRWTRRAGARGTEVHFGLIASRRLRLPGNPGVRMSPIFSVAIHRERVRFDSVALAGEDYTSYSYSDLFGVIGVGLSIPVTQDLSLRGMLEVLKGSVAQHARLDIEVALGFGGKRQRR